MADDVERGNRILDRLPDHERARLASEVEPVEYDAHEVLWEPTQPIEAVYFPLNGVVSVVNVLEDGPIVEVATVGNEGFVGLPVFLGSSSMNGRAFYQISGSALQMSSTSFRRVVANGGSLHSLLQLYTQALMAQIAQTAACNRVHPIEERCARWLLQTHDRVEGDEFDLTHEFLAQMLGVRRASVSVAAGMLQRAGLIRYSRGHMTIADRTGLEEASCECYRIVTDEYERLLGAPGAR